MARKTVAEIDWDYSGILKVAPFISDEKFQLPDRFAVWCIIVAVLAGVCLTLPAEVSAHPVAQGHGIISCSANGIVMDLSVSEEQVSVWDTFRSERVPGESEIEAHARYMAQKLRLRVGGEVRLPVSVRVAPKAEDLAFHTYHFLLAEPGVVSNDACSITLFQDFLREFEFAPGNPWEAIFSLRVARESGSYDTILLGSNTPLTLDLSTVKASRLTTVTSFFVHGVHHILTGYDHVLFVVALVLGVSTLWRVLIVVSVFTAAHTVTLVLSVLDIVRVPAEIVDPIVTASIVSVAGMNVLASFRGRKATDAGHRLIPAFLFGLFHGLGFASGLADNLAEGDMSTTGIALVSFAGGVEVGHQMVIIPLVAFLTMCASVSNRLGPSSLEFEVRRYISLVVFVVGVFYFGHSIGLLS